MFNPGPPALAPTVIDIRLRGLRRIGEDRLFEGWGVAIASNRIA